LGQSILRLLMPSGAFAARLHPDEQTSSAIAAVKDRLNGPRPDRPNGSGDRDHQAQHVAAVPVESGGSAKRLGPNLQTVEAGEIEATGFNGGAPTFFTYYTTNGYALDDDYVGGYNEAIGWEPYPGATMIPGDAIATGYFSVAGGPQYVWDIQVQHSDPYNAWWIWANGQYIVLGVLASSGATACERERSKGAADAADATDGGSTNRVDCRTDADCPSQFCDLGRCASPSPNTRSQAYGTVCSEAARLIGPFGTQFTLSSTCSPGYLCLEGRCRSCASAEQCYQNMGLLTCSASRERAGLQCRDVPDNGEEVYVPVAGPLRVGHPIDRTVPQPGEPEELILTLDSSAPANARLVVVWWHQRAGEPDEFLQIAYDASLPTGQLSVQIPLAQIAMPYSENLICFRRCTDRATCACDGSPDFALASIAVTLDSDGNGSTSFQELQREQFGGAAVSIGWAPTKEDIGIPGFGGLFAGNLVAGGFGLYLPNTEGLLQPQSTPMQVLSLCTPGDATCTFPVSRLFCRRDCERDWDLDRFGF
jgi:hypothetical protein